MKVSGGEHQLVRCLGRSGRTERNEADFKGASGESQRLNVVGENLASSFSSQVKAGSIQLMSHSDRFAAANMADSDPDLTMIDANPVRSSQ